MTRLLGTALLFVPLLLAGCPTGTGTKPAPVRPAGQWQNTFIGIQKYNNALFRDAKTGEVLHPDDARDRPEAEVTLESGDMEELTYRSGRLRYGFFARQKEVQPYVVERPLEEKDFEALDDAFYKDKFFGMPATNWSTDRFPMYFVQYDQLGKGWKASFTPSLNKLLKTSQIVMPYFGQLGGQDKLGVGTKQYAYYLTTSAGQLNVSVSTLVGNAQGEPEDRPWKIKSATYELGKGSQSATVDAAGGAFSLPLPTGDGSLQLLALKITSEGDPGTWETLIPVRTGK